MIVRIHPVLLLLPVTAFSAQPPRHTAHTAPQVAAQTPAAEASHHAFLDAERSAIERGDGFGMALAADRNGYPGPKHVLELKAELNLTPEQETAMQQLMGGMKARALTKGKEVLEAEARLEQMFAAGATPAEVRAQVERIATLRAELRWIHLETHLAARKLLNDEQLRRYQHLRHGQHAGM